uniref:NADH-ubiquinone oxidoreductase chain 4L n=1 Tax=Rhadinosa nigrocyanea TaxID=2093842 RepID=A0A343UQA8_9CUCU|nr:NADH dehydrogenase subunit 4L [Rhadinosa nigrocyanea]AVF96883.1 NADH dehydrogenase subunit 4L [Rhadinosa nigrocyanea]
MYWLFFIIYFSGLIMFIFSWGHFLVLLLSLEFMVIGLFLGFMDTYLFNCNNLFFCMIYLTMTVCEGVLGLSIMVMMIRLGGNDYLKNFSFLW